MLLYGMIKSTSLFLTLETHNFLSYQHLLGLSACFNVLVAGVKSLDIEEAL